MYLSCVLVGENASENQARWTTDLTRLGRTDRWKAVSTAAHRTPTTHCVIDAAFKRPSFTVNSHSFPVVLLHNTMPKINGKNEKEPGYSAYD